MKLLVSILLLCGILTPMQAQNPTRLKGDFSLPEQSSFIDALLNIANRYKLPLAVEWVKSADTLKRIQPPIPTSNVDTVLDSVVSSRSGYTWRLEDGIVHVFPKAMLDDPRNPLNVVISRVPDRSWTVNDANNFVFETVRDVVRGTGRKRISDSVPVYDAEPQFHISGQNASVRDILNKIIMASNMKIWIATFPNNSPLTIKGFWEVTPMYPNFVRAANQPFWIFLRWGDIPWTRLETPEQ
jgi:hypothetical protein